MTRPVRSQPIGYRIMARRLATPMSRVELAERTGLTPQKIEKIESGRDKPDHSTIVKIHRALAGQGPMSDREKQLREMLRTLTAQELYLLKSKWIHEEQLKRQGIVVTPKEGK